MIRITQLKVEAGHNQEEILKKICKMLKVSKNDIKRWQIQKMSIDARKKPQIFYTYVIDVCVDNEEKILRERKDNLIMKVTNSPYLFQVSGNKKMSHRPVIIGSGPAGLFCAYMLAENGYCPIVLEQGEDVIKRTKTVEEFWDTGKLKPFSNVQFGEGGAGTFSDGKLNTLVKDKYGRNKKVLEIFVKHGADPSILYDSKAHIGTDVLQRIIKNMRCYIESRGGQVIFNKKVTDIELTGQVITTVVVNNEEKISSECVILAIGHSARDTFEMLYKKGIQMEQKNFAVGFRVEHPQKMINEELYGKEMATKMPPAPYKVTAKTSTGRGVYSFCMCPGGYVVNASSEENRLAVNGMSYSGRDSQSANSAIIISVTKDDFPSEDALAGMEFQRMLEEKAFALGKGNIPYMSYGDLCKKFSLEKKKFDSVQESYFQGFSGNTKGNIQLSDLSDFFSQEMMKSFMEGMEHFEKIIPGFTHPDTRIYAVESRTSSPVRILRDDDTLESNICGLYPCGEGAGYAGGITSAGMDGIKIAERIASVYMPIKE